MSTPQRRMGAAKGRPVASGRTDSAEMLDRLVKQGRITAGQAAQYRVWESAKPPLDGGRERFDAWMASRPNLPGLPPMGPSAGNAERKYSAAAKRPGPERVAPKSVLGMLDKLERENKITEAQAEQVRRWEKARPNESAGQERLEAWLKARPDVPGLRGYW